MMIYKKETKKTETNKEERDKDKEIIKLTLLQN
jgi:hypothetical protein